jgi:exocyst complex component 7
MPIRPRTRRTPRARQRSWTSCATPSRRRSRADEAVGFVVRTKAAGRARVLRLTEAEAEEMRFEGPLDEALLGLQDLFEALLLRLKHVAGGEGDAAVAYELGTDEEVETTTRMARTLAGNDCSDICLDIYVNVV